MHLVRNAFVAGPPPARSHALVAIEGPAGSGRRTLARGLAAAPGVARTRLAPQMDSILSVLADIPAEACGHCHGLIPPGLVHATHLIEAAVQFRYQADYFENFDLVVAERWLQTWEAHCGDIGEYAEWYLQVAAFVPVPDLLIYLRVSPEVAAARLMARLRRATPDHAPDLRSPVSSISACSPISVACSGAGATAGAEPGGSPCPAGGWDEARVVRELTELCARYDELMTGADCVVFDADAPARVVLAEVTAILAAAGIVPDARS